MDESDSSNRSTLVEITVGNIENYRNGLQINLTVLPDNIWMVFEKPAFDNDTNGILVPTRNLVSTKNQLSDPKFRAGLKPDPRETAFGHMIAAMDEKERKRLPIQVKARTQGGFEIVDGNATAQVAMLARWKCLPASLVI